MPGHIFRNIVEERTRQDRKWGANRDLPNGIWLMILMEEIGEASKAELEEEPIDRVIEELTQSAAVIVAWIENLERRKTA